MSEANLPQRQVDTAGWTLREGFLLRQLPYIAVLVLAIAGVGLHEHCEPTARRLLGVFVDCDGGCLRCHAMG
jgi:hypothetical protein